MSRETLLDGPSEDPVVPSVRGSVIPVPNHCDQLLFLVPLVGQLPRLAETVQPGVTKGAISEEETERGDPGRTTNGARASLLGGRSSGRPAADVGNLTSPVPEN